MQNDAHLHAVIGEIELDLRWFLYEDGKSQPINTTGTFRYPKWKFPLIGNLLGTKVYTKSKIYSSSGEELFWALITLISLMSNYWKSLMVQKVSYEEYLAKEDQSEYAFCVFPWWELKVTLNQVEYFIKYKPADIKKNLPPRICIWTETKNQINYIRDFVPNIKNIPQAVKVIIEQNHLITKNRKKKIKRVEVPLQIEIDFDSEPVQLRLVTIHQNEETLFWKICVSTLKCIKYIFTCAEIPSAPFSYYATRRPCLMLEYFKGP